MRRRAHIQAIDDRVHRESARGDRRVGELLPHPLNLGERACGFILLHEAVALAEAGARGPFGSRVLHAHATVPIQRLVDPVNRAKRFSGVVARGGDAFSAREEARDALEARQRRVNVRRRVSFHHRQTAGEHVGHGRRIAVRVVLQQSVDGGLGGRDVARDFELVLCDLEQGAWRDRARAERIDNRLQIFQRFRVPMILQKRHAALVLPTRELLVVGRLLRARVENKACREARQDDARALQAETIQDALHRIGTTDSCPACTVAYALFTTSLPHTRSTLYEPAAISFTVTGGLPSFLF